MQVAKREINGTNVFPCESSRVESFERNVSKSPKQPRKEVESRSPDRANDRLSREDGNNAL